MKKKNLLIALTILTIISGTLFASFPNAGADTASGILSIVKSIQTIVQSIQTTVQKTNTNLNNVKIETIIVGPPINIIGDSPSFKLTANQPWDLMAVYVTTNGVNITEVGNVTVIEKLTFGFYQFGSRTYLLDFDVTVADGSDVTDFPIFAGDMTNRTQSVISIPANVTAMVSYGSATYYGLGPGFTVSFKILIQRPIDPNFSYNVTWGVA